MEQKAESITLRVAMDRVNEWTRNKPRGNGCPPRPGLCREQRAQPQGCEIGDHDGAWVGSSALRRLLARLWKRGRWQIGRGR
jgi:hypothetical protein